MTAMAQARHRSCHLLLQSLILIVLMSSVPLTAQTVRPFVRDTLAELERTVGGPVQATLSPTTGLVTFISFAPLQQPVVDLLGPAPADERALSFLDDYGAAFGILGRDSVSLTRVTGPDEVGMEHVRLRQMVRGVPVTGGELIVHLRDSAVVAINAKTIADLETVSTTPVVSAAEAAVLAADALLQSLAVSDAELSEPRLELLNKGLLGDRGFATGLTWFIEARRTDLREYLWIDALNGKLVLQFSQLTDTRDRKIYDANDPDDGTYGSATLPGTLVRSEGDPPVAAGPDYADDANAAYDFSGDTYDYFWTEHGRDSFDGAGATIKSTVHYCPNAASCPYANAFWNGSQMVYGEGFPVADDVDAHELTHAVTEFTANLFYYMQSGALNESFSDIFGETVDLTNSGGTDTLGVRWDMGEDVPGFGAIRNMMDPTLFGDPGKMSDTEFVCQDPGSDGGGVHSNSGVPNHAYALMVDGGSYNTKTVTGMGMTKAGKIEYRALSHYLTSASDFLDAYNALKQACEDLIGTAGITAADCTEVGDALDAVEMSSTWPCTPAQAAIPDFCPAGQAPALWHFNNVESSSLSACPSGSTPTSWCLNRPDSLFGAYATSGDQSYWGYNWPTAVSRGLIAFPAGTLPANARMQFNHSHGFENTGTLYWDGGRVRYSTNGGANWSDGGPLITAGDAYGGPVSSCCSNPIGGGSAFVADTWGYTASQLDLSSLAGQTFAYGFWVYTDWSFDDYGWWVDDVRIYTCAACVASRILNASYNGLASFYGATVSVEAGSGFRVSPMENVTLQAPTVRLNDGFSVESGGELTVISSTCP